MILWIYTLEYTQAHICTYIHSCMYDKGILLGSVWIPEYSPSYHGPQVMYDILDMKVSLKTSL